MYQESGRSMVEIIGVVAIMALISAGSFALVRSGMVAQQRSVIVDDVAKIVSGVRTLYADYDGFPVLNSNGTLAAISVDVNGPRNVTYSISNVSDNDKNFIVKISNLSAKDCQVLGAKAWTDSVAQPTCASDNTVSITYRK